MHRLFKFIRIIVQFYYDLITKLSINHCNDFIITRDARRACIRFARERVDNRFKVNLQKTGRIICGSVSGGTREASASLFRLTSKSPEPMFHAIMLIVSLSTRRRANLVGFELDSKMRNTRIAQPSVF